MEVGGGRWVVESGKWEVGGGRWKVVEENIGPWRTGLDILVSEWLVASFQEITDFMDDPLCVFL